jgi:ribosomal-protein-alanine N-acetyltransferase
VFVPYPDPPLTDDVVRLRPWAPTDLQCVAEASRDPYIVETTSVPLPFSDDEGRAWIERQWGRMEAGEGVSLAIADVVSDEAVGGIFLLARPHFAGTFGLGYWTIERARRRGFASRGVSLLARWALLPMQIPRVEALVEPQNAASRRILERTGFHQEGHLRSYVPLGERRADVVIYSLLLTDIV